jgi:DNA-binding NarL/FixJ family response regulator
MGEASGSPSLVLVEQHEALRDGLAVLLERRGFDVLGCATTAARGEEVIREREPDVAVVGVDLPDERGTELVRRVSGNGVDSKFVIYTGLDDPDLLEAAYRSGARGLVAKPAGLSRPCARSGAAGATSTPASPTRPRAATGGRRR